MEIGFGILWKVKVYHNVDGLNIDTTSEKIRADQVSADSASKVMEDTVSVGLRHSRVRVEARVAKLGNLLCQQLDTVCRVAENDGLIDLELESVLAYAPERNSWTSLP